MAHNVEPMDIDSDFDDKENSVHNSNVYLRTPCTEKGYEELDVSELNMKLRYSITPANSPMSKSYTANSIDSKNSEHSDDILNANLTRSFNSALSRNDTVNKSVKSLPLQPISSDQFLENNRNASVLRTLESTQANVNAGDITVTISATNENDENFESHTPSSSSSTTRTPEVTTPTKELPRTDGGSPIMRGLKSVLNMFRPSQSPIPPGESGDDVIKQILSPADAITDVDISNQPSQAVLSSTPIAAHKNKESASKRNSPLKESIVFNEDLEKELLWKNETTILFSQEKIPIHKLFYQQPSTGITKCKESEKPAIEENLNATVEYMDISCNDSVLKDQTMTDIKTEGNMIGESDGEFVDCETTFTNDNSEICDTKENKNIAMLENKIDTPIDTTHIIQTIQHNNELISESNSATAIPTTSVSSTENVELLKEVEQLSELNVKEANSNAIAPDKTIVVSQESGFDSEVLSEVKDDTNIPPSSIDMNKNVKEGKTVELQLAHEVAVTTSDALMKETNVMIGSSALIDMNESKMEVQQAGTENMKNIYNLQSQEGIEEQLQEIPHTSKFNTTFESGCSHPGNIENKDISQASDLKQSLVDSSYKTTITTISENIPTPSEKLCDPLKTDKQIVRIESDNILPANIPIPDENKNKIDIAFQTDDNIVRIEKDTTLPAHISIPDKNNSKIEIALKTNEENVNIEKDNTLPANIPLPDEDNYKIEIQLNESDSNTNASVVKNTTFDTELKSAAHVGSLPIDSTSQAKQNVNEAICQNGNTNLDVVGIKTKESKFEFQHISVTTNEGEIVNDFKVSIKADIDKIITDAEQIINENQSKSVQILKQTNNLQSDVTTITSSTELGLPNVETVKSRNIVVLNASCSEFVDNVKHNDQLYELNAPTPIDESNLLLSEKNSPIDVTNDKTLSEFPNNLEAPVETNKDNLSPESNINESNMNKHTTVETDCVAESNVKHTEEKLITSIVNTTCVDNIENLKGGSQIDLLPDVIPDAIVCNVPIEIPVDCVQDTTEKNVDSNEDMFEAVKNEEVFENKDEIEDNIDDELILSENNSPFVSIAGNSNQPEGTQLNLDECVNPFATKTKIAVSPPNSPKISSKGYNFNFDEIDDPFATKTKIRLSPPPNSPNKNNIDEVQENTPMRDKNRRKSQPARKKAIAQKNKINKTFSGPTNEPDVKTIMQPQVSTKIDTPLEEPSLLSANSTNNLICSESGYTDYLVEDNGRPESNLETMKCSLEKTISVVNESLNAGTDNNTTFLIQDPTQDKAKKSDEVVITENKSSLESLISSNEVKATSSSEQSAYYSAETSGEATKNGNVFNIPEMDDANFNPFITKSKVCKSPPLSRNESFSSKPLNLCDDSYINKTYETLENKECGNISNVTFSSKTTEENDITVREVHTEDEDTIEGPFLEAENFDNDDKFSEFDGEDVDMMHFSELPPQNNEEQLEGGEMFIDAEAYEFLLNQNNTNVVADSGKESLFLKFDPLFARVSTDGVLAALNKIQKRQSTPKKVPVAHQLDTTVTVEKPVPGPSNLNTTQVLNPSVEDSVEELNVTVSKPMMVVTPAVNPIVTPRNKSVTPTSSNRRSITFTSPAIAVIDRLLSMSGNNSLLGHDSSMTQISREQHEADHALTQLRELLAEKEIHVYNLRSESKELKDRLSSLESQMRSLESESEERLRKINDLNETLNEKTKLNKSMAAVVEEYERTIASLIAEGEQDKKRHNEERAMLIKERDEQTAHLASMEVSFSDLHSKYEKSKQIIKACKANEDACKKSIKEFEDNLSKMQSNYELLKQHATTKLNDANQQLEKMNRAHEADILKLNAMLKRKELHINSLEETLAQKTKANEELTTICDELINKVGRN